jgi:hypothetical protein
MTVQVTHHAGQDHKAILAQDVMTMILTSWIQINVDYVLTRHVSRRHKMNIMPRKVAAVKGEKFSDIALKAGGAAATAWAAGKISNALSGDAAAGSMGDPSQLPPFDDAGNLSPGFHISPESGTPYYNGELAPTPTDIAAGYGPGGAGADSVAGLADTGAAGFGGGTYTTMPGDQGGFIAQAQGVPFKDLEALNPQITNWNNLPPGTELQLPPSGPNTGSVWQSGAPAPQGPEILGGPSASGTAPGDNVFSQAAFDKEYAAMDADMGGVGGAAGASTSSPLSFDPATNSGTVTLPSGETIKASVFPQGGQFQPRLPVGGEMIKIPYGGQEVTGYVHNGVAYFPKFPADAAASATTSTAGTLSGVTAQQIYNSPVYQQIYAQEIARYGAEPSARAIQAAQTIATAKAKAAMVGAVRENTDWISTVKMRRLPLDRMIDQKLTTLSWALNESVGKPQGRSMHLTPLGVYTVFENIRRVGEAAATATKLEPTFSPYSDPKYKDFLDNDMAALKASGMYTDYNQYGNEAGNMAAVAKQAQELQNKNIYSSYSSTYTQTYSSTYCTC